MALPSLAMGQSQLVLLDRNKIVARYSNGDDFSYKPKKSRKYVKSFVTDLREFAVITYNDTVPFSSIDKVSLKGIPHRKFSTISRVLITAGVLYFAIDQFNNILVQGNKPDMVPSVWKPSLACVGIGLTLTLVHKNSIRIRFPVKLMTAPYGSSFYKSDQ